MSRLTFEYDPEPYGKERDGAIMKMAQEFGVETIVRNSHTLYSLDRFVTQCTHTHTHTLCILMLLKNLQEKSTGHQVLPRPVYLLS